MKRGLTLEPPVGIEPTTTCLLENSQGPVKAVARHQNITNCPPLYSRSLNLIGHQKCNRMQPGQAVQYLIVALLSPLALAGMEAWK